MKSDVRTKKWTNLSRWARALALFVLFGVRPGPSAGAADLFDPPEELLARGIQVREHRVNGIEVLEIVLGRVDFDARLPLVMRLHGRASDWQLPSGSYANVEAPYRLIVPRGPLKVGKGRAWAKLSVRSGKAAQLEDEISASADRLVEVLRHFRTLRKSVGEPIVTGFSQGGMVALAMAVRHPEAVGTVLPIASHLVVDVDEARLLGARLPTVHALHGAADSIVVPGPAAEARDRLRAAGFVSTLTVVPEVGHAFEGEMAEAHRRLLTEAIRAAAGARFDFGA